MTSYAYVQRLSEISDEYRAANAALAYVEREWRVLNTESEMLKVTLPHVRATTGNLDATYIIRAFVRFEALLREYLAEQYPNQSVPYKAEALINRVAKLPRPRIPDDVRDIVHSNPAGVPFLSFQVAFRNLVTYLYWLPDPS